MKKLITILAFLLLATEGFSQLTSFVWSGDTLFCVNPSTGVSVQVSNKPVPWSSVMAKPTLVSTAVTINGQPLSSNVTVTPISIGLGNVDNTSDANKPVSSAVLTALNLRVNISDTGAMLSPYAKTTNLLLKLNISDTASMLSKYARATEAANTYATIANLNLKAPIASPTFTGTVGGITSTMVGLGNVTNESKATMFTNAVFTGTFTAPNTTITNAMLAGSIDLTSKMTGVLPFANGGIGAGAATSATTGTMTVNMTTAMITVTPTGACTFNASGGVTGQTVTFVITTSGISSFVLTFGTNYRSTGTLATGTTTAKIFTVTFIYNGSTWIEIGRTIAQ